MRANRVFYVNINHIIIVLLLVCISVVVVYLHEDNVLFSYNAKLSIIVGLFFLIFCVKRSIGGYPFKLFTLFLVAYFIQRILLLLIDPDLFDFKRISLTESDVNSALLFLFFSIIAILLGLSLGSMFSGPKRAREQSCLNYGILTTSYYRGKWIKISYALLAIYLFALLILKQGYGVLPGGVYSWLLRPTRILPVILAVNILLLMQSHIKLSDWEKRALKIFVVLYVFGVLISGSRGAFFSVPMSVLMIKFITGDLRIKAKFVILLLLMIPVLSLALGALNVYRANLQLAYRDASAANLIDYSNVWRTTNLLYIFDLLSIRMNGFDLLAATMNKQAELIKYFNIKDSVLTMIDSLYPGTLFEYGIEPSSVVPLVFRDIDVSVLVLYGEHLHLISMSFIYFGYFGGLIFLMLFYFITARILFSIKKDVVVKIIIANMFVFYPFETGFLEGIFNNLFEQLVVYGIIVKFITVFKPIEKKRCSKIRA